MLKFEIDNEQHLILKVGMADHNKECKFMTPGEDGLPRSGAIGGALTYSFTPTSIGTIITVECACGFKLDCTGML